MKKNWFIKLMFSLICIISLIFTSLAVYASTSYHATKEALSYLDSNEDVSVVDNGNYITFIPVNTEVSKGVIFYPGALVDAESYAPLLFKLAENGIQTFIVRMPFNIAFFKMNACNMIKEEYQNINSFYAAGHSLGGVAISKNDLENYDGLILLASYSTKQVNINTLLIRGENDGVLDIESYEQSKDNYLSYSECVINGGNHAGFAMYGEQKNDHKASILALEQIEKTREQILTFMC